MRLRGLPATARFVLDRAAQHRHGDGRGRHRDEHEDGQIRGHVREMLAPVLRRERPQCSAVSGVS